MNGITTHVLDTSRGLPAPGVAVKLEKSTGESWIVLGETSTDSDGRARFSETAPDVGVYRLTFEVGAYFEALRCPAFYPLVQITFTIREAKHHHVPLLLSPFGYSTYRGS